MAIQVTVNMVTAEVVVNSQDIQCSVNAAPVQAEINCCGNGLLGVPGTGTTGDVLTKTGAGATDYAFLPPGSGANLESWTAGENLSAGRVVIIDGGEAWYFQPATAAHGGRAWGITTTSATAGNSVTVQREGTVTDAAFSAFSDESVYVGTDGELQTTWPGAGLLVQKAGVAGGSNKVKIDFSIQIQQL